MHICISLRPWEQFLFSLNPKQASFLVLWYVNAFAFVFHPFWKKKNSSDSSNSHQEDDMGSDLPSTSMPMLLKYTVVIGLCIIWSWHQHYNNMYEKLSVILVTLSLFLLRWKSGKKKKKTIPDLLHFLVGGRWKIVNCISFTNWILAFEK